MFEQLVRPFQTRPVTTTRRIVPVVTEAVPETAILSWGKAGTVAAGVQQPDGVDLEIAGFRLNNCAEDWNQKSVTTEEVEAPVKNNAGAEVGKFTVNRIRDITFHRKEIAGEPFSYAAVGVSEVIAGLRRDIPGSSSCDAKYKFNYD